MIYYVQSGIKRYIVNTYFFPPSTMDTTVTTPQDYEIEVRKDTDERYTVLAVNFDSREKLFGTDVSVSRSYVYSNEKKDMVLGAWEMNYGSCGAGTYEEKKPFVDAIVEAHALLARLNFRESI
tara:strand:- start:1774 stop:2142 length:369 start_codon:yes stop_codon:yes gene_type:complete